MRGRCSNATCWTRDPKLTTDDFDRADEVLATFDDAFAKDDVRVWGQLNWRFHSILYAPARDPRTMAMIQNLSFNVDRYLRLHLKLTRAIVRARTDHRRILDYCRKRKIEAACDCLREDILDAGDELIKFLAQHREIKTPGDRKTAR